MMTNATRTKHYKLWWQFSEEWRSVAMALGRGEDLYHCIAFMGDEL